MVDPREPARDMPDRGTTPGGGQQDRVAALFDRAVAEQVAEQRGVAVLLGEVRDRLARLELPEGLGEGVSSAVRDSVDAAVAQGTAGLSGQLRESIDALTVRAGESRALVAALGDEVAALRASLSGLPEVTEDLRDGVAGIRTDLRQLPEQLGGAVVVRIAEPVELLRGSVRELIEEVAQLGDGVAPLQPSLTGLEEQLAGVAARLAALELGAGPESGVAALHADLRLLAAAVAALPDDLPLDIDVELLERELVEGQRRVEAGLDALRLQVGQLGPTLRGGLSHQLAMDLRGIVREEVIAHMTAAVESALDAQVARTVQAVVQRTAATTAATEARLRQHVDEAVLALAEIVLRGSTPRRALPAG